MIIRLRWAGHVARMEKDRGAFKVLTGKSTGKRPVGRPERRLEDNIRMDPKKVSVRVIGLIRHRIGTFGEPLRMRH